MRSDEQTKTNGRRPCIEDEGKSLDSPEPERAVSAGSGDGGRAPCALRRGGGRCAAEKAATVRTSAINARPPVLSPSQIRAIRSSLNLSETLFATFLGVRIATLRSWEQGRSAPSSLARRFLVVIRDDPDYWKEKLARAAPLNENGIAKPLISLCPGYKIINFG